ncbi:MAG: DUF4276 family protein [Sphingobacteriaceae bacterium]|nr:MAG: DUF4276 family protein [Sphingobacteriaceae bacterium]
MIVVGLVGEAPNDTKSLKNLLEKKYHELDFKVLLKNIRGSQLDEQKTKHLLRKEYQFEKPDIIIFIRDLDALEGDAEQLELRRKYFRETNSVVDYKGIYLLNIFEIEALLLADINCFNKEYQTNISKIADPMKIEQPKEFLKTATQKALKQFNESHNPSLFNLLNFDTIVKNCRYFNSFVQSFNKQLIGKA